MSFLRPDEQASESIIRRAQEREGNIKKGIKTAIGVGTTALGAGISAKILPLLSQYIPPELAMKGINKVAPKIGNFLESGLKNGLDLQGGLDYLKEQFNPSEEPAKEDRNIIQQYSPELHEFIQDSLRKGYSVLQTAALAQINNRFRNIISKLKKDHKLPWHQIMESIYGKGDIAQPQNQEFYGYEGMQGIPQQPNQPHPNSAQGQLLAPQQGQQQQQQTQQGNSQAKDQLLQAMQALSQQLRS